MDNKETLGLHSIRRWGAEIEICSFDGIARGSNDKPPEGIDHIGNFVREITGDHVDIKGWQLTHNNEGWVIKPDSSAGIEICSPVFKGWGDLHKLCRLVEGFRQNDSVVADNRCSFHLHANIQEMNKEQRAKLIAYYIKCEPIFMDSVPFKRKTNKYCQLIGASQLISHDSPVDYDFLISSLGKTKYTSFNVFHLKNQHRDTCEFRIAECEACTDPFFIKNWVKLLLHFIERTQAFSLPPSYEKGNQWSSYLWFDLLDVLKLLGFDGKYNLSPACKQTRNWFLARLNENILSEPSDIMWGINSRKLAYNQLQKVIKQVEEEDGIPFSKEWLMPSNLEKSLYDEQYIR